MLEDTVWPLVRRSAYNHDAARWNLVNTAVPVHIFWRLNKGRLVGIHRKRKLRAHLCIVDGRPQDRAAIASQRRRCERHTANTTPLQL